jgi:hypothetical protein
VVSFKKERRKKGRKKERKRKKEERKKEEKKEKERRARKKERKRKNLREFTVIIPPLKEWLKKFRNKREIVPEGTWTIMNKGKA